MNKKQTWFKSIFRGILDKKGQSEVTRDPFKTNGKNEEETILSNFSVFSWRRNEFVSLCKLIKEENWMSELFEN